MPKKKMAEPVKYDTKCEKCDHEIEVALYPRTAQRWDAFGRSGYDEPSRPPYNDPAQCPACNHPIVVEDIEQKVMEITVAKLGRK